MIKKITNKINSIHIIVFILFFYFLFPTENSSLDAYLYASHIKFSENLFSPHHLLYNAFLYVLINPIKHLYTNVDILLVSKFINSLFLVLNLVIFYKILSTLNLIKKEKIVYILITGFSFSLWRYGTENETYIIPITFSLLGSLYFLKYLKTERLKYIFFSGLFASVACLFHQIQFFWWLGLLVGIFLYKRRFNVLVSYCITALIVPVVYTLVLLYHQNQPLSISNVLHFVLHDFYTGSATPEFGWKNFFFVILNSFRTFFQIHPTIFILIKRNLLFSLPILLLFYFMYVLVKSFLKKTLFTKREIDNNSFIKTHFLVFILHFLFAFYAVGNVEFMVMIPFLILLGLLISYKINFHLLSLFALTLFIWNFSYGIFPNKYFNYYNDEVLLDFIIKHPNDTFVVKNADLINKYYYKTGIDNYKNIILSDKIESTVMLENLITKNNYIYTDIIDKPSIFNRAKIISLNFVELDFKKYPKEEILFYEGLFGKSTIHKIQHKD